MQLKYFIRQSRRTNQYYFQDPSPLNSLVTKRNTSFTANDSHIKKKIEDYITEKYDQTTLIFTEITQERRKCNILKCST